jgi:hypothetical protein
MLKWIKKLLVSAAVLGFHTEQRPSFLNPPFLETREDAPRRLRTTLTPKIAGSTNAIVPAGSGTKCVW